MALGNLRGRASVLVGDILAVHCIPFVVNGHKGPSSIATVINVDDAILSFVNVRDPQTRTAQEAGDDRLGRVSQFSGAHAGVNDCTGQQDAAEVGQGVFVVAGRDAAPLLEPVEAALDGVS